MDFCAEQREDGHGAERARDPLDNRARSRLHLSCRAVEVISLAAERSG